MTLVRTKSEAMRRPAARPTLGLQRRLTINVPGDRYEQEADRAADSVVLGRSRPSLSARSISFEADIDATDPLEFHKQNTNATAFGIAPQMAALKALSHPRAAQLQRIDSEASSSTLEIAP